MSIYTAMGTISHVVYYESNLKSDVIRAINRGSYKVTDLREDILPEPIMVTSATRFVTDKTKYNSLKHDYIIYPVGGDGLTFRRFRSWKHLRKFFNVRNDILESVIINDFKIKGYKIERVVQHAENTPFNIYG